VKFEHPNNMVSVRHKEYQALLRVHEAAEEYVNSCNELSVPMSSHNHTIAVDRRNCAYDNLELALTAYKEG